VAFNTSRSQSPERRLFEGRDRRRESDAKGVGRAGAAAGEDVLGVVHQDAFGLRAAAVESQDATHKVRIREK
jgi:hypothetical protein